MVGHSIGDDIFDSFYVFCVGDRRATELENFHGKTDKLIISEVRMIRYSGLPQRGSCRKIGTTTYCFGNKGSDIRPVELHTSDNVSKVVHLTTQSNDAPIFVESVKIVK